MKNYYSLTFLLILLTSSFTTQAQKKDSYLKIYNQFDTDLVIQIKKSKGDLEKLKYYDDFAKALQDTIIKPDSVIQVPFRLRRALFLWPEVRFDNGSKWIAIDDNKEWITLKPGDTRSLIIRRSEVPGNSEFNCQQEQYLEIVLEEKETQKVFFSKNKVHKSDCYYKLLQNELFDSVIPIDIKTDFLSSLKIFDNDIDRNQIKMIQNFLGSLAIIRHDTVTGERRLLNYLPGANSGKSINYNSIEANTEPKKLNRNYFFKDTFLVDLYDDKLRNDLIGLGRIDLDGDSKVYKVNYNFAGLRNISITPDMVELVDKRWNAMTTATAKEKKKAFLEDFIHAVRTRMDDEVVQVVELNTAIAYQSLEINIETFCPYPSDYDRNKYKYRESDIVNEDGILYYEGEYAKTKPGPAYGIIAMGTIAGAPDLTELFIEESKDHIETTIKNIPFVLPGYNSRLRKIKDLNYPGYKVTSNDQNFLYKKQIEFIQAYLEDYSSTIKEYIKKSSNQFQGELSRKN